MHSLGSTVGSFQDLNRTQHILNLKGGAVVMLVRNLTIKEELYNRTVLITKRLHHNVVDAVVLLIIQRSIQVLIP